MSLDLRTTSEQDAQQFLDMVQGLIAMAKANDQKPEATEFLDKLSLSLDGRILAARMSISQADIERQLVERAGSDGQCSEHTAAAVATTARAETPLRRHSHLWDQRRADRSADAAALR